MLVLIILKREHWSTQLSQSSVLCKDYQNNQQDKQCNKLCQHELYFKPLYFTVHYILVVIKLESLSV